MSKREITKKIVRIHLKEFHGENLPADVLADVKRGLSPTFVDKKIAKGITQEEEDYLLPLILETNRNDPNYFKEVKNFWNTVSASVKYSTGITLDVSTDQDGHPINPKDYILYKRALISANVAKSREEVNKGNYWFYIHDEEESKIKTNASIKALTTATQLYLKYDEDEPTIDMLLWMFGENPALYEDFVSKKNELFEYIKGSPEKFIDYCQDPNLTIKSEIYAMIYAGIIRKAGDTMLYSDYTLGDNMQDAVAFFKDGKSSQIVNNMKSELKKARK